MHWFAGSSILLVGGFANSRLSYVSFPYFYKTSSQDYSISGIWPSSGNLKNTKTETFRKLDLFPPSGVGWEAPVLLGLLERINLNHLTTYISKNPEIRFCQWKMTEGVFIFVINFSCYFPLTMPNLKCLYNCSHTDIGCPVIQVSSL
jgi:hypothetical protein